MALVVEGVLEVDELAETISAGPGLNVLPGNSAVERGQRVRDAIPLVEECDDTASRPIAAGKFSSICVARPDQFERRLQHDIDIQYQAPIINIP